MTLARRLTGLSRGVAFSPSDISGLQVWWDAANASTLYTDAGSTNVSSDGDSIYQANDQSGNSRHFNQSTSGDRPLYKTGIINGRSVLQFADTTDKGYFLGSGSTAFTELTIYCVFELSAFSALRVVYDLRGTATEPGGPIISLLDVGGNWAARIRNDVETIQTVTTSDTSATAEVWEQWWNGTTQRLYKSGTQIGSDGSISGTVTVDWGATYTRIGGYTTDSVLDAAAETGDLGELCIFDSALSSDDRTSMKTYLGTKWGISVS